MGNDNNQHTMGSNAGGFPTERRRFLEMFGATTTGGLLAGCLGREDDPETEPDDGADPEPEDPDEELTEVIVAQPHFGLWDVSHQAMIEAAGKAFFADEGIELSWLDTAGGGETVRTTLAGDAQIGLGAGTMGVLAAFRESPTVRIVANQWNNVTDVFWFSKANSGYDTLEDCVDASIGYSRPGASSHMMVLRAIEYADLEDAEPVSVGGPPDSFAAVQTDEVDVSWAIPPFFIDEIETGEFQHVFMGGDLPPFDDMTIRVHLADAEWLEANADTARAFFRAFDKSTEWAYDNIDESAQIWADVVDEEPEFLEGIIREFYPRENLQLDAIRNMDEAIDLAVGFDFLDEPLTDAEVDEVLDLSYLSG